VPVAICFPPPVVISHRPLYLWIPRSHVHYEANQEQHDEDEETGSGNLSCGKSHKSKPKSTRYQRDQKENQRVIQHDGKHGILVGIRRRNRYCSVTDLNPINSL